MTASCPGWVTPSVSRLKSSGSSDVALATPEPRISRLKASPIPELIPPPSIALTSDRTCRPPQPRSGARRKTLVHAFPFVVADDLLVFLEIHAVVAHRKPPALH